MATTTAPTWQAIRTQFTGYAVGVRAALSFFTGSIADVIAGGVTSVADFCLHWAAERVRDTFLLGAKGEALTTLANDHWDVQRSEGNASQVTLTIARPTAAGGAGTIAAGSEFRTQADALGNSLVFTTDVDLVWVAETSQTVAATAASIGTDYNVAAATITRVASTLFDATFTVNNVTAAAGGANRETDDELVQRVRSKPLSYRRGTLDALEYGALTVAGVANAVASEDETGIVTVYVADASGSSNGTMTTNVTTELRSWAAAGAAWQVLGGTLLEPAITITVYTRPGFGDELKVPIAAAITARVAKLRVGEQLYHDMIDQAAMNVSDGIRRVVVSAPAADPAAGGGDTVLIRAGTITITVVAESA